MDRLVLDQLTEAQEGVRKIIGTGMFVNVEYYMIMILMIVLFALILLCLSPCTMSAVQRAVKTTVGATKRSVSARMNVLYVVCLQYVFRSYTCQKQP